MGDYYLPCGTTRVKSMKTYYGFYWATFRGVRDIWRAVGKESEGGEQVFQCYMGHEVARLSQLMSLVKVEER